MCSISDVSRRKKFDLLIAAFERAETPLKLVLAGGSSHTDRYVARLREPESDQTKFLDWLSGDALEEVLTKTALFVLPSDWRDCASRCSMLWAPACVLASDVPKNCEVIEDTGFVFKRGDVPDLHRMLTHLLSDARPRKIAEGSPAAISPALLVRKSGEGNSGRLYGIMSPAMKQRKQSSASSTQ
jgi:glycosyltransferase involved in cell wall biosynthesis